MSEEKTQFAAIHRQIMWHRLIAVVEEQAQIMIRTAFSTTVREAGDLSAGVFDLKGRMLAQAVTGTPGHVNAMSESVGHFLKKFPAETMRPGDHYVTNDPWLGTGHLHDFTVVTPAFRHGKIIGLLANTAHVIDVGGLGMGADARSVFEEGMYIPILRCFEQGRPSEVFFDILRAGTRLPVELEGDI
jgi:N-methylhydantoinase B